MFVSHHPSAPPRSVGWLVGDLIGDLTCKRNPRDEFAAASRPASTRSVTAATAAPTAAGSSSRRWSEIWTHCSWHLLARSAKGEYGGGGQLRYSLGTADVQLREPSGWDGCISTAPLPFEQINPVPLLAEAVMVQDFEPNNLRTTRIHTTRIHTW